MKLNVKLIIIAFLSSLLLGYYLSLNPTGFLMNFMNERVDFFLALYVPILFLASLIMFGIVLIETRKGTFRKYKKTNYSRFNRIFNKFLTVLIGIAGILLSHAIYLKSIDDDYFIYLKSGIFALLLAILYAFLVYCSFQIKNEAEYRVFKDSSLTPRAIGYLLVFFSIVLLINKGLSYFGFNVSTII